MTKTKNTKRALFTSVLSMMLCIAMLIGSTFAWFTDSVTSGKNRIVAGNLDIEVTHTNNTVKEENLQDVANLFPITLWEPGAVSYETFNIVNKGSLAFDYQFNLNAQDFNEVTLPDGSTGSLKDVIKIGVIDGGVAENATREQLINAVNTVEESEGSVARNFAAFTDFKYTDYMQATEKDGNPAQAEKTFTVVAYWEPTATDNNYNINNNKTVSKLNNGKNELYIDITVNVFAQQRTYENDSFDQYYDKEAFNPDERVNALAAQGYAVIGSEADIPNNAEKVVLNGDITLSSINHFADGAVFDANGYTVTINHLYAIGNPDSKNGNEKGAKNVTIKNGVFEKGSTWGIAVGSATFENCTFNNISPYITPNTGMNISVKKCVFNDTSLQICWGEGEKVDPTTVTTEIIGNTFNYTATKDTNHAIALNAGNYSDFSKVNVSGNTFNNNGETAFSALYITNALAKSIVKKYSNNVENNAAVGYKGSDGYGKSVVDKDAKYVVFDGGAKVLQQVTAATKEYTIPSDVTELGDSVFSYNSDVKKVIVPANVKDLGRGFDSSSVEEVILSEGLETISSRAFRKTPNLKTLVIPSTVTTIVENAFQQSGIETIVIPASVTSIEFAAFQHCEQMKTVTIEGNPVIANYAFRACSSLTDVYLKGDNVTFADGISMVFTVAENNNNNSQITIHVVNETVKGRVAAVTSGNINIVID